MYFIHLGTLTGHYDVFYYYLGSRMATDWVGPYTIKSLCGKNLVELERNGTVLINKVNTVQLIPAAGRGRLRHPAA